MRRNGRGFDLCLRSAPATLTLVEISPSAACLKICIQQAMNRQIRIAPDGAREVAILLARQRKMSDLLGRIFRSREALEHREVNREGFGLALDLLQQHLKRLAIHVRRQAM